MKKILLALLMVLVVANPSFSETCTFQSGGVDLNWSTTGNWDCGHVPIADDAVVIPGLVAAVDVARVPATSGKLASLTATTTGQMTIALDNARCNSSACSINVTGTIQAGTKPTTSGFILITGGTNTMAIVAADIIGGSNSLAHGVSNAATSGTINITVSGEVKGGANATAYGVNNSAAGILNITGNVTGATGVGFRNPSTGTGTITGIVTGGTNTGSSPGVQAPGSGAYTLIGSLVDTASNVAWEGKPPVWTVGNAYYYKNAAGAYLYVSTDPGVSNVKDGTTYTVQGVAKEGEMASGGGGGGAWGF